MKTVAFGISLLLCCLLRPAVAQDAPAPAQDKLTARVTLGQTTILPYEAVSAMASLGNETTHPIDKVGYSRYIDGLFIDYLGVSIYSEQEPGEGWDTFDSFLLSGMPPPPGPIPHHIFAPGDAYYNFVWLGANYVGRGRHPFSQVGQYRIRSGGNLDIFLEESLRVIEPQGADAEALKDVEAQKLYLCFTPDSINGAFNSLDEVARYEGLLKAFVLKHPRSRYADWARWGQMLIRTSNQRWVWPILISRITKDDLAINQEYQREYEQMAPQLFPFLRANALYRAGILALLTGDKAKGDALLNQAIALKADATLPRRVSLVRQQIQKHPKLIYKPAPPSAEDVFQSVVARLEAERYDINGLKQLPEVQKEYFSKFSQLFDERQKQQITEQEFGQAGAKLFDFYIRTYTKPLSPEAWQLLQKQRAVENASR